MSERHPRFVVLSIDGVPYGLARKMIDGGEMPNLASIVSKDGLRKMRSVHPTVSCVAWATYATGRNPGKHGIYGFIDRHESTYDMVLPNASARAGEDIWQILSKAGKRVFGMNVPATYPPQPVNGILIGGFLSPSVGKAVYPRGVANYLQSIDYRIDSDASLARRDKRAMLDDLDKTLDARMEAMFHFLGAEEWDFFHTHIMGTDRINHFLWRKMEQSDEEFAPAFFAYYRRIDEYIGKLLDSLPEETPLMILSDHGFCSIKHEVQLSRYLVETGWTQPQPKVEHPLSIDPTKSRAYCLIPGRIFVNLAGREPGGIVSLDEYDQVRQALAADLMKLRDTQSGEPVIRKVVMREDVYWPRGSQGVGSLSPEAVAQADGTFGRAADLIAIPHDGYDLKLGLGGSDIFRRTELEGMHTYDDAFMVARGIDLTKENLEIMMSARLILRNLNVEPTADMDGSGDGLTAVL